MHEKIIFYAHKEALDGLYSLNLANVGLMLQNIISRREVLLLMFDVFKSLCAINFLRWFYVSV